jgi:AraC-like DNA-binding protein
MVFIYHEQWPDSPYADRVTASRAEVDAVNALPADGNCYMFVQTTRGETGIAFGGPLTQVKHLPVQGDTEWFGVRFQLGAFLPHLPPGQLLDNAIFLPLASGKSFWLHGAAWELPTRSNVDVFIERLVREELLVRDPLVDAALQGHAPDASPRSVQRRFLHVTGLTHTYIQRIERARRALALLEQGRSILDTVDEAGYFDQAHLTRSLKHFIGMTPAQVAQAAPAL